ncbi:hypothetical protein F4678DRAFT_480895 [Xylaria arbuscula]|nr:hypothetical protein F4678DRAFT_480895 [Xylaria arbuscula]
MAASNANDTSNGSAMKNTIQDFGLVRENTQWEPKDTAFIDPFLTYASLNNYPSSSTPPTTVPKWSTFKITSPSASGSESPKLLNGYAVSPSHYAYVTFCVKLITTTDDSGARLTPMRYRDMIADNYVSACISTSTSPSTTLSKLRWLGVSNIMNTTSRVNFKRVYEIKGHDILARGAVEIRPDVDLRGDHPHHGELRALLLNDPFTRGVLALLHHHARDIGRASVKRFVFISEGFESNEFENSRGAPSALQLRLNLVVELTRARGSSAAVAPEEPFANL